jgi:8-hydroxy-5-deazaflavin:NADPH oxidoreductase
LRVALVGGTGDFGRAIAVRLRDAGVDAVIGSRSAERAAEAAAAVGGVEGATNEDAVRGADLVVLATKAEAMVETAAQLADPIGTTPVLSVGAELRFAKQGVFPSPEPLSLAERVAERLHAPVVAGLHSLAASNLGAAEAPEEDALVCGDDPRAKELALDLAGRLVRGRAIDAGPLAGARALEGLTAVIVNVNKRYRAHAGVRISGLP